MKRKIKIALTSVSILIVAPILILVILSFTQQKSVHKELVQIINNEFDGKIQFRDFSFSYIRYFPKLHVGLKDVLIKDGEKDVLRIGKLSILLNSKKLWNKKIKINKLIIHDAELFSEIDSAGNKTRLFPTGIGKSGNSQNPLTIDLNNIKIKNSKFYFGNKIKSNRSYIQIENASFDLLKKDSLLIFSGKLEGKIDSLISNNATLIANQPVKGSDIVFKMNQISGVKELLEGNLELHTLKLQPKLKMKPYQDGQMIELHIGGGDNFNNVLDLLEFHTKLDFQQINPDAILKVSFNQTGFINPYKKPYSEIDFEIVDAEFSGKDFPFNLNVGGIRGNYNNGKDHSPQSTELVIDTLYATVSESSINGRFKLSNLQDPVIDAHLITSVDLTHLISKSENFSLSGTVNADLKVDGKISDFKNLHSKGEKKATGTINIKNLQLLLKDKGYNLNLINGSGLLNNHLFEVTSLMGAFNESAFHFQGKFENLDEYIIEKNKNLAGKFILNFDNLDIRKFNVSSDKNEKGKNSKGKFNLDNLSIDFLVNGKNVITEFGNFQDVKIDSRLENNELNVHSFGLKYEDGILGGNGKVLYSEHGIDSVIATIHGAFKKLTIQIPEFKKDGADQSTKQFKFPEYINAHIKLDISHGELLDQKFENLNLQADILGPKVTISQLGVNIFGGRTALNARLLFGETGITGLWAKGDVNFDRIDLENVLAKFNLKDSTKSAKNKIEVPNSLDVNLSLRANQIDYKDVSISNFSSAIRASELKTNKKTSNSWLFGGVNFELNAKASSFSFKNVSISDADLAVNYTKDKLELNHLKFAFLDGTADVNGYIKKVESGFSPGYIYSNLDSIDIKKLFISFDNFDQDVFNANNSSGFISLKSHYYFEIEENFVPIKNRNLLIINSTVHHAELDKVEPIEKALFFVGHKSKDKMIISELNLDAIMIKNKMYFLNMFMNDNIANLNVFGEINFDNKLIDLGLEVSLTDLFFRSRKERFTETMEGIVKFDKDAKLFVGINGTLNDSKLSLISDKKFNKNRQELSSEIKKAEKEYRKKLGP